MSDLAELRRDYARRILGAANVSSPRLEDAYAAVPREDYAGPGPWKLFLPDGYEITPDADPARLYQDVLIGLLPEKKINNGQPSGHALWLSAADPRPCDHVVHVGTGGGYYTAILRELVGAEGRVTGIEYDAGLARRAAESLTRYPNVTVVHGDGVTQPFAPADVIYVNAGVVRPAESWLDGLKQSGRLVLPMTSTKLGMPFPAGAMFCFERDGADYRVRMISQAGFVSCEGLREEAADQALADAFRKGGASKVTRLVRGETDAPEEQVWLRGPGWRLLY